MVLDITQIRIRQEMTTSLAVSTTALLTCMWALSGIYRMDAVARAGATVQVFIAITTPGRVRMTKVINGPRL